MHGLFQITRVCSRNMNHLFADYDLRFSEWAIILTLMENGPMTQRCLADYLNIEPSAVSRHLVKLQEKGYVIKQGGADKRKNQIVLTELAGRRYQAWDEIVMKRSDFVLSDLSEPEKKKLYEVLNNIYSKAKYEEIHKIDLKGKNQND